MNNLGRGGGAARRGGIEMVIIEDGRISPLGGRKTKSIGQAIEIRVQSVLGNKKRSESFGVVLIKP